MYIIYSVYNNIVYDRYTHLERSEDNKTELETVSPFYFKNALTIKALHEHRKNQTRDFRTNIDGQK